MNETSNPTVPADFFEDVDAKPLTAKHPEYHPPESKEEFERQVRDRNNRYPAAGVWKGGLNTGDTVVFNFGGTIHSTPEGRISATVAQRAAQVAAAAKDPYKSCIDRWRSENPGKFIDEKKVRQALKAVCFGAQSVETLGDMYALMPQALVWLECHEKETRERETKTGCHTWPEVKDEVRAAWVERAMKEAPLRLLGEKEGEPSCVVGEHTPVDEEGEINAIGCVHWGAEGAEDFRQWLLAECRKKIEPFAPCADNPCMPSQTKLLDQVPEHIAAERKKKEPKGHLPVDQHIPGEWD